MSIMRSTTSVDIAGRSEIAAKLVIGIVSWEIRVVSMSWKTRRGGGFGANDGGLDDDGER